MASVLRFRAPLCVVLALGGGIARLHADDASLEARLQRLEGEVGELRAENQALRTELGVPSTDNVRAAVSTSALKPVGRETTLAIGGAVQVQADFGDQGDARFTSGRDRFYVRRARINAQGSFAENFEFRVDVDLANTLAEASGNRAQLVDGYIGWTRFDFAHVRFGQIKSQFGFEETGSDLRLPFVERTLASDRLTPGRQVGVQLTGEALDHRVAYATGFFNGTGSNTTANDDDRFLWTGRFSALAWRGTLLDRAASWNLGASALHSHDTAVSEPADFGFTANTFAGRHVAGELDTQFHVGPLDLWVEYLRARYEPRDALPAHRVDADGWYAQATLFLLPHELQAALRYDVFDPNLDIAGNRTRTCTVGANWFIKSDDLKLQFDYLLSDIDGVAALNKKLILRLQTLF